ncbi:MAG: carboxypeptidase regulatory-like domain-containing protein [Terriglobia bacterium]
MRQLSLKILALGAVLIVGLCMPGWGQTITSTILGRITDASGAEIPGAAVTVTNQRTGISATTVTDSSGSYSVSDLFAGTYAVAVSKHGFQTYKVTGIAVPASATVRQNAVLQVGATRQEVTVAGSASLVHTDSPTIGGTITSTQISKLPFAIQSIDTVLSLVPGAQTAWGASNPQTGGATHWGGTNFTLNGVTVDDPGNGGSSYSYSLGLVNLPDLNSLQEFHVQSGNMDAQYRGVGSVTLVTKQGSNQFHGSAYEYVENTALNANTLVLNAAGKPRAPLNRNQFGANVGGPILKNKAFFFFDYAGLRQRTSSTEQLNFPSQTMRQGDFSALCSSFGATGLCAAGKGTQLYNPFTGQPFAGNQIPASMITSQAKTMLSFIPLPNSPANSPGLPLEAPNFLGVVTEPVDVNTYTTRLDYHVSGNDSLYGIFNHNTGFPWGVALGTPSTYGNATDFGYKDDSIAVTETHIFGPATLNDFRVGWFDHASIRSGQNLNFDPRSLFPQLAPSPNRGLPTATFLGYEQVGDYGKGYYDPEYDVELSDDFTHVRGSHTIKAGIDETGYKVYTPTPNAPLGSFSFNGQWTGGKGWPGVAQSQGNAIADFLLGAANTSTTGLPGTDEVFYDRDWEFYVQDTWQATRKLTLDYGIRYMYQTPWGIRNNTQTFLNIATNQLVLPENTTTAVQPPNASAGLFAAYPYTTTAALGLPESYFIPDTNNWAPRFGFAYRPFSSMATVIRGGYGVFYNFNPAFVGPQQDTLNPPWGGTALNYSTGLPGKPTTPFLPDLTFQNPFPSGKQQSNVPAHPTINIMDRNFLNPVAQQWNLTLEHQFGKNWMARGTYLGSQTHHIQWFQRDINIPVAMVPNVVEQNYRPLRPWANIPATRTGGKQNFNQLQLEAQKRFSGGFLVQAEYQWTNSLDDVAFSVNPQNWHDANADYGPTSFIQRHVLVVNYIYELPVGAGRRFLPNAHGVVNALLGGWQVSGITSYATGVPFSVNFSVPSTYVGWLSGRADLVAGASPYAGQSGSHNVTSGVPWFNPAAFAPPQPWTWGNSERDMLFGPGQENWDMSALKDFRVREHATLEVRADFFDAFNHFNLGNPSVTIGDTRDGGAAVPTAGKIFGGSGNRTIQIGARLQF